MADFGEMARNTSLDVNRLRRGFWRLFTSIHLAIVLLVLIVMASIAGTFVPQAPAGIASHPAEYAQWLQEMRGKFGPAANAFFALGMFDLYDAWWFKSLLALLGLNVVFCTINRLPTIIRSVFVPAVRLSDSYYNSMPSRISLPPSSEGLEALSSTLRGRRYKVLVEQEGGAIYVHGDKNGWAKLGTLATHAAILLAIIVAILGGFMGFAEDGLIVAEGQTVDIGHGTGLGVRNDQFTVDYYDGKTPTGYRSSLTLFESGREVARQVVRVNEPLSYAGVRLHERGYGAFATVEVRDDQGRLIQSTTMNMQPGQSTYYQGDFQVLGTDLLLAGLIPTGDEMARGMTVVPVKGDKPLASSKLKVGESQLIEGYRVTLVESREYTVLRAVKDPGSPLIWIASPLFILGVSLTLYLPRRRVWARIDSREILLTGAADRLVRFPQELDDIAQSLRDSL
ncbi:MAG: cytochrome c biogenesis protein ResB [Dehalococcoidia bacterium]|nr:cytochrome c biogenesis protein ResB [Dehalococcoidia bacterium]